jgi:AcrR family transcriptional regulator
MRKGDETRTAVVDHALRVASRVGFEGLSIGNLARDLGMSKSGLFAHFQSKEALQLQVLEAAAARFVEAVVTPALRAPRGEPRLRAMFERWIGWSEACGLPGGCLFVAAAVELDYQDGPVRDALVRQQLDWLAALARAARIAVEAGHFRPEVDPEQFAHDLYAIVLGYHHAHRLLRRPDARARAERAFEALLAASR